MCLTKTNKNSYTGLRARDIYIGKTNNGTLNITNGDTIRTQPGKGYIGYGSASSGKVIVDGSQSAWWIWKNNDEVDLFVGHDGNGTLEIKNGGKVNNHMSYIGYESDSTGNVTVDGNDSTWSIAPSSWDEDNLVVGYRGEGKLDITNGGNVESQGYIKIGFESGSTGKVTVSGTDSKWKTKWIQVGYSGHGKLSVTDGGRIYLGYGGAIGVNSGSMGEVTISGAGSIWEAGVLHVGFSGHGKLTVSAGGVVGESHGIYQSTIGTKVNSVGEVTVTGTNSSWTIRDLFIGNQGHGTLNVTNGGKVTSKGGFDGSNIGAEFGAVGIVNVAGTNSLWTTSDLYVGNNGHGTLNITDGGMVTSDGRDIYIGHNDNSTGIVTVDGAGSTWDRDRGRENRLLGLPSLRTGQADFPHTALQSVVHRTTD